MSIFSSLDIFGSLLSGAASGITKGVIGAVSGGTSKSKGADTQAYGVRDSSSSIAESIAASTGLMSPTDIVDKSTSEFKAAETYKGANPWDLVKRVNSWFPEGEE